MRDIQAQPLSRADFEARLRAIGAERYHDRHPFHARLHGGQCTPDEVRAWVRDGMADHAVPKRVELVAELPRNAVGKTDKQALRERLTAPGS